MARRPKGEKRKARCLMATDAEWARIEIGAKAAGLTKADFVARVVEAWEAATGSTDHGLPLALLRRLLQGVLVLERLEKLRFEKQNAADLWRALFAEVGAGLDAEIALGDEG